MVAELTRQGTRHVVRMEGCCPGCYTATSSTCTQCSTCTDPDTRAQVGITVDELVAGDWTTCQQLGTEAHVLGDQGIRTYSATGVDTVLVVFPELLGGSLTTVELVERWDDLADLA